MGCAALGRAFLGLDLFPQMVAAFGTVAEDVRVAALHLVADRGRDIGEVEQAGFLGHAGMEDDLEEQIAEFVLEIGHVTACDRVGDLIGFLDRVRRDRLEGLDIIPFAARLRVAQPRSEEHTSELQSLMRISYAVFCLKKKKKQNNKTRTRILKTDKLKTSDIKN